MNKIWYGVVSDGKVVYYEPKKIRQYLVDFEGKEVEVIIRQPTSPRTLQQNKYLWLIYKMIAEYTGHTPEEIHEVMKAEFLKEYVEFMGGYKPIVKSTTSLNTKQFSEYVEKVKDFAYHKLGLVIPEAGEVEF